MNQAILDILIFAVIALFLFFKLRSVLGEVDESEDSPTTKKSIKTSSPLNESDRLSKLNPQMGPGEWPATLPDFKLVANATAHNALLQFNTVAKNFDPYDFLHGAKRAFPMIIEAFSKGDKKTLKNLLSENLYEDYAQVIDDRINNGETWHNEIIDFKTVIISNAVLEENIGTITVDFNTVEKMTVRDKDGNFIDGQDGSQETSQDRWSFTKDLTSKAPIWILTQAQEVGSN